MTAMLLTLAALECVDAYQQGFWQGVALTSIVAIAGCVAGVLGRWALRRYSR